MTCTECRQCTVFINSSKNRFKKGKVEVNIELHIRIPWIISTVHYAAKYKLIINSFYVQILAKAKRCLNMAEMNLNTLWSLQSITECQRNYQTNIIK